MNVKYDMVVDFARPAKSNTLMISEGDTNSRECSFTLLSNKKDMDMIDVTVATVRGVKSDGSVIYGDATIETDDDGNKTNVVTYTIPAAMTDEAGNVTMTITLLGSDNSQITSFEFYVKVRNALYNEDDLVSESDLSGFRDLLNRCMKAVQKIEEMTENEALPNPYPLSVEIEGETTQYNGTSAKEIHLNDLAYLSETIELLDESLDESAAGSAAIYAACAEKAMEKAEGSMLSAKESAESAEASCTKASEYASYAVNASGTASGYAEQAKNSIKELNLPKAEGTYRLKVTMSDGIPSYSWMEE